ncbi:hypothetical protein Agub_g5500 [Astrephomene gubernaculifera]|uniref:Uncharacterized protein n=1 Tax=Astrephomene gubernaculifera TaxID=47775 RepID=A0AAD3DLZ4_9CHLO|nr:hypothetical protein Agub_g5500 [Astrephomene gubernaculifera]
MSRCSNRGCEHETRKSPDSVLAASVDAVWGLAAGSTLQPPGDNTGAAIGDVTPEPGDSDPGEACLSTDMNIELLKEPDSLKRLHFEASCNYEVFMATLEQHWKPMIRALLGEVLENCPPSCKVARQGEASSMAAVHSGIARMESVARWEAASANTARCWAAEQPTGCLAGQWLKACQNGSCKLQQESHRLANRVHTTIDVLEGMVKELKKKRALQGGI